MNGVAAAAQVTLANGSELDESALKWHECVPAWLLTNSMRMEGLQFMQLTIQELENVWRKQALRVLTADVRDSATKAVEARMSRFVGSSDQHRRLSDSVKQFREVVDFVIEDHVPS